MESNDFCQLSRSLPVFVGFPPKIIGKKIHLRIHRLTHSCILDALSGQLGSWKPFMHLCFIHLVGRDSTALPGEERLLFCWLAVLPARAWRFAVELRTSASSFLEMVYFVGSGPSISLPIPPLPKAKIRDFLNFIS